MAKEQTLFAVDIPFDVWTCVLFATRDSKDLSRLREVAKIFDEICTYVMRCRIKFLLQIKDQNQCDKLAKLAFSDMIRHAVCYHGVSLISSAKSFMLQRYKIRRLQTSFIFGRSEKVIVISQSSYVSRMHFRLDLIDHLVDAKYPEYICSITVLGMNGMKIIRNDLVYLLSQWEDMKLKSDDILDVGDAIKYRVQPFSTGKLCMRFNHE
jgi:hypothetical protein